MALRDKWEKFVNFCDVADDFLAHVGNLRECRNDPNYGEFYRKTSKKLFDDKVEHKRMNAQRFQVKVVAPFAAIALIGAYIWSLLAKRPWGFIFTLFFLVGGLIAIAWMFFSAVCELWPLYKEADQETQDIIVGLMSQDESGTANSTTEATAPPAEAEPPADEELDLNDLLAQAGTQAQRRMQS